MLQHVSYALRMGSGGIQAVQTGVVAAASFAPTPSVPVASVVSVASVQPLPPSFRPPSTSRSHPDVKTKDSATPTEASPRFYQSGKLKSEDVSPSDSPKSTKSKPLSPRAKSPAWKTEEAREAREAPWEVPYSMRARSGSISPVSPHPGKPRSESQKRRYHDLYEDHEIRLQKWQAKLEEKKRKEEEEVQKNIANTCSPRNFSQHQFQNWSGAYASLLICTSDPAKFIVISSYLQGTVKA